MNQVARKDGKMAEADLDVVIRQNARQQYKSLVAAAKKRRDKYLKLAGSAKDAEAKTRYRHIAKNAMLQGTAAAKRLQLAADNAADSYARSMRNAMTTVPAAKPAKKSAKTKVKKKTG